MMSETVVKERPILFNGEMVRAILDGRKTQTRRIVKQKLSPTFKNFEVCDDPDKFRVDYPVKGYPRLHVPIRHWQNSYIPWDESIADEVECPYEVGQHLWVRETWRANACFDEKSPSQIAEGAIDAGYRVNDEHPACDLWYEADGHYRPWKLVDHPRQGKTRPSIHMPRWASRITLEITDVRVERINDISGTDAFAEGVTVPSHFSNSCSEARYTFAELWESINGPGSWNANPWVWVVEFRRLTDV